MVSIDHIVIGASDLAAGRAWAIEHLGLTPLPGGQHAGLATHNCLLNLDQARYLEIISIDPAADAPTAPRWFGLDTPVVQARLANGPCLIGWVAAVSAHENINHYSQLSHYQATEVRQATRANYRWQFAFTPDGSWLGDGIIPHLIQWQGEAHPSRALPASTLRLTDFSIEAPAKDCELLRAIMPQINCTVADQRRLSLTLDTPKGLLTLSL
jgi:Glyoxalase-like domain